MVTLSLILAVFFRYSTSEMSWPWNPSHRSLMVIEVVPFDRLDMVSYYSSIEILSVRCTVFWHNWPQKCRDLENRVRGPSRSLECHHSIEHILLPVDNNYGSISCRFWDIQYRKMSWPRNRDQRSLKVIESLPFGRLGMVFISVLTLSRFWDIRLQIMSWPWNRGQNNVTQGHRNRHVSMRNLWFPVNVS